MNTNWIVLDMSYLAYRAAHSTGSLTFNNSPTGVLFGVLRDIRLLNEQLNTERFIFAFDGKYNLRKGKYPWYKKRPVDAVTIQMRESVHEQLDRLRNEILPPLCAGSILYENGYEADDLIASAVNGIMKLPHSEYLRIYIVSADQDLYQCLRAGVWHYKRSKSIDTLYKRRNFKEEFFNLPPSRWPEIKSIAGCGSDMIPGVGGVGNKTAAQYIAHKMNERSDTFHKIKAFCNSPQYKINLGLIRLPYAGCPEQIDKIAHVGWDESAWMKCLQSLGIRSLTDNLSQRFARRGIDR